MKDTIVLTAIYQEFWGTQEFRKSAARVGLEVYNVFPPGVPHKGNGFIYGYFYKAFHHLKNYCRTVIYSDGADTIFQKAFIPPTDRIIYSAEKQVWPPLPALKQKWNAYWNQFVITNYSPWLYLNGGNWCGPIDLLIDWYETYGLNTLTGDINGQGEQAEAFIKSKQEGFPIELDIYCKYFQTTAFENRGDFSLAEDGKMLVNNWTGNIPCVLHGNGRTEMKPIYDRWK